MAAPLQSDGLAKRKRAAWLDAVGLLSLGLSTVLGLAVYPPVDDFADSNLVFHMNVQHIGLVLAGVMMTYAVERILAVSSTSRPQVRSLLRGVNGLLQRYGAALLALAAAVFVFWHIPHYFDLATTDEWVHIVEHATFALAGTLIVVGSRYLDQSRRLYLFVLAGAAMMAFGGYMAFDPETIYTTYPASQQGPTGAGMFVVMVLMSIVVGAWRLNRFLVSMEKRGL